MKASFLLYIFPKILEDPQPIGEFRGELGMSDGCTVAFVLSQAPVGAGWMCHAIDPPGSTASGRATPPERADGGAFRGRCLRIPPPQPQRDVDKKGGGPGEAAFSIFQCMDGTGKVVEIDFLSWNFVSFWRGVVGCLDVFSPIPGLKPPAN